MSELDKKAKTFLQLKEEHDKLFNNLPVGIRMTELMKTSNPYFVFINEKRVPLEDANQAVFERAKKDRQCIESILILCKEQRKKDHELLKQKLQQFPCVVCHNFKDGECSKYKGFVCVNEDYLNWYQPFVELQKP